MSRSTRWTRGGNSFWSKLGKFALNGGDLALTLEGVAQDVTVLTGSGYTLKERAVAAASIGSEVLPGSVRDVKDVARMGRREIMGLLGYQSHHIVPQSLRSHGAIKATGFDIDSYKNIIELPETRLMHGERTVHRGKHGGEYTRRLERVLNEVDADIKAGRITQAEGLGIIEAEVKNVRQEVRKGELELNRASRDEPPRKAGDRERERDRDKDEEKIPNGP